MSTCVKLFFDTKEIGFVKEIFFSDDVWYGIMHLGIDGNGDESERRVVEYIDFVKDWNEKAKSGSCCSPEDFSAYADLIDSNKWYTKDENEKITKITKAPIFFLGGEVSWRTD